MEASPNGQACLGATGWGLRSNGAERCSVASSALLEQMSPAQSRLRIMRPSSRPTRAQDCAWRKVGQGTSEDHHEV
eukprot:scaffold7232_cov63-Phaeocystis_antarctica.AAC.5